MMLCRGRERKDDETVDEEQMNFRTKIGQCTPHHCYLTQSRDKQNS